MRYYPFLFILVSLLTVSQAIAETLRLASLEWAPYVGNKLDAEGVTSAIVAAAAVPAGMTVEIAYFPWSRTVQEGLHNPQFAGYFPAFYLKERERSCYFSKSLGNSVIGFAHLKPFDWTRLDDLKKYRIGVVHGYANGEEFDRWVKMAWLQVDTAPSDISNLRKLLADRVDAIVIDHYVMKQLLQTAQQSLPATVSTLQFHPRPLTNFSMHICFQKTARGLALRDRFDAALQKIDVKALENHYFLRLLKE